MVAILKANSSVTSLLGNAANIGAGTVDQKTVPPYVRLSTLSTDPMEDFEGSGGMRMASMDFDCVATKLPAADALADAVEAVIRNYTGTAASTVIDAVILSGRGNDEIPVQQGSANFYYVATVSADVQYHAI